MTAARAGALDGQAVQASLSGEPGTPSRRYSRPAPAGRILFISSSRARRSRTGAVASPRLTSQPRDRAGCCSSSGRDTAIVAFAGGEAVLVSNQSLPSAEGLAARRAAVVSCWLCGIRLHHSQMMPDGGDACLDVRWYCKDARACTERWTSTRRLTRAAGAAPPGSTTAAR